ncbi:MAG: PQQ-binding-like beta-propeller repeat protein [Planctomycetota bacterium]|nr:PQQ-binding-like beta-propeller repeat protein [Planctomycetota bacterium]
MATTCISCSTDGDFYCLDKRTGKQVWKKSGIRKVVASSTGSELNPLLLAGKNTLHAVNPVNGNERWSYSMKHFAKFLPNNADSNALRP